MPDLLGDVAVRPYPDPRAPPEASAARGLAERGAGCGTATSSSISTATTSCASPSRFRRCASPTRPINAEQTIALMRQAADRRACLVLFPELGLSAYSCDDLFQQRALLDGVQEALQTVVTASAELPLVAVVGLPLAGRRTCSSTAPPSSARGASSASCRRPTCPTTASSTRRVSSASGDAALGHDRSTCCGQASGPVRQRAALPAATHQPLLTFHVEICEDVWVPTPPSSYAALAGATVLLNLSASNITVGKAEYRHHAGRQPVGALPGRLPLLRRRLRRIDDRPGLGRPRR